MMTMVMMMMVMMMMVTQLTGVHGSESEAVSSSG
jgi:hypothetical protein